MAKSKNKARFVEVAFPAELPSKNTADITVEYRDYKINLGCGATDMRKSINGLSEIVCEQFQLDPEDKIIFAFCNNSRNVNAQPSVHLLHTPKVGK